jgi:hypothetical protein
MVWGFDFLERYYKDDEEFLNHILTDDETWVSFLNAETKKQSKHTFPKQTEEV